MKYYHPVEQFMLEQTEFFYEDLAIQIKVFEMIDNMYHKI